MTKFLFRVLVYAIIALLATLIIASFCSYIPYLKYGLHIKTASFIKHLFIASLPFILFPFILVKFIMEFSKNVLNEKSTIVLNRILLFSLLGILIGVSVQLGLIMNSVPIMAMGGRFLTTNEIVVILAKHEPLYVIVFSLAGWFNSKYFQIAIPIIFCILFIGLLYAVQMKYVYAYLYTISLLSVVVIIIRTSRYSR